MRYFQGQVNDSKVPKAKSSVREPPNKVATRGGKMEGISTKCMDYTLGLIRGESCFHDGEWSTVMKS